MTPHEARRGWAERSAAYSPRYYAHYGPDDTSERVRRTLDRLLRPDAPVLEVGSSSGRHLAHLHEHGYGDLHGVDVNGDAFDVMADAYPDLAAAGSFHHAAIEDAVHRFEDDRFGAVFTVETLQHVHDDETWVFGELARVADDVVVTVECERRAEEAAGPAVSHVDGGLPLYYRRWDHVFTELGMEPVETRPAGRDTLRAFRHP